MGHGVVTGTLEQTGIYMSYYLSHTLHLPAVRFSDWKFAVLVLTLLLVKYMFSLSTHLKLLTKDLQLCYSTFLPPATHELVDCLKLPLPSFIEKDQHKRLQLILTKPQKQFIYHVFKFKTCAVLCKSLITCYIIISACTTSTNSILYFPHC